MSGLSDNQPSWKRKETYEQNNLDSSVTILAFAGLAVYFDHWWIVLLAAFFLPSVESRTCDDKEEE